MSDTWGALQVPAQVPAIGVKTWVAATVTALGALVIPASPSGFVYQCTTAGTTGGSQPAFPSVIGNTVSDNGVVWTCFATHQMPTAGDDVAGDPFLQVLLSFLQTTVNANLAAAWGARGVAPNRGLVGFTFAWDPGRFGLHEGKLPALYAWRDGDTQTRWLADDYILDEGRVTLLYVFEPHGQIEVDKVRASFTNALRKSVIQAIESERQPSWVVLNDPDPDAASDGSCFSVFAGFFDLKVGAGKPGKFRVDTGADKPIVFDTYEIDLVIRERQTRDTSTAPMMLGLNATINTIHTDQDPNPLTIGTTNVYAFKSWTASSFTRGGYQITPVTPNGYVYQAQTSGITAASEPTWPVPPNPQNLGVTVQDGGVLWQCVAALQTN